ncbi:MAG: hypothetical protein H9535_01245 [Ignavibacteria bacterium]|nr:hypothetical protein [Ignavibacteria bacterium]
MKDIPMRLLNKLFPKPTTASALDTVVIRDEANTIRVCTENGVLVRLEVNGRVYTAQMLAENKNGEIVPAHGVGLAIRYGVLRDAVIT